MTGPDPGGLLDFLLARFAEERATGERALVWSTPDGLAWIGANAEAATLLAYSGDRLLAECEARRRIVQGCRDQADLLLAMHMSGSYGPADLAAAAAASAALWAAVTHLAQPYSGHRGFQSGWLT